MLSTVIVGCPCITLYVNCKLICLHCFDMEHENSSIFTSFAQNLYRKRRACILPARPPHSKPATFIDYMASGMRLNFADTEGIVMPEVSRFKCSIPVIDGQAPDEASEGGSAHAHGESSDLTISRDKV